jgi:hypothetical protein
VGKTRPQVPPQWHNIMGLTVESAATFFLFPCMDWTHPKDSKRTLVQLPSREENIGRPSGSCEQQNPRDSN